MRVLVTPGLVMYALYGHHHSVEGRRRKNVASQQKYQIVASDKSVSSPLALYGTIVLQQPNRDNESTRLTKKDKSTDKTEL